MAHSPGVPQAAALPGLPAPYRDRDMVRQRGTDVVRAEVLEIVLS
jgi:hypothetical protein